MLAPFFRTRFGQERHQNEYADLATSGSVIAISRGQRKELAFVQIVKARGELEDRNVKREGTDGKRGLRASQRDMRASQRGLRVGERV